MKEAQEAHRVPTSTADDLGTFYTYRPTTIKRILSGISLGVALLFFFAALYGFRAYQGADVGWNFAAGLVFTVSTGLPGAYWLLHTLLDVRLVNHWATQHEAYSTNWQWLAENEANNPSHDLPSLPDLAHRHWWGVWLISAILFLLAASLGSNMSVA